MERENADLAKWLAHIEHSRPQHIIDLGLERVIAVGHAAKVLNFSAKIITVAGTNGKGTTVTALATLLRVAGLQVGTYTSPHLLHFNERIQINGQNVEDSALCAAFSRIEEHAQGKGLTFFEYTTLAALAVFQAAMPQLDVIILEVGLGGRLDAVNVITPTMAIITSISLDHEAILGATRSDIAVQKAGILRERIPVILSKDAKVDTMLAALKQYQNPVWIEDEHFAYRDAACRIWHFEQQENQLPQCNLPESSVSLALAAYTVFSKCILSLPNVQELTSCLDQANMIGRFQTVNYDDRTIILDVAHNPASAALLAQKLSRQCSKKKLFAVWASLEDKDLAQIVAPLLGRVSDWFVGGLGNVSRAAAINLLAETLQAKGVTNVSAYESIWDAFIAAKHQAAAEDMILVFGSFYTVSGVLGQLMLG